MTSLNNDILISTTTHPGNYIPSLQAFPMSMFHSPDLKYVSTYAGCSTQVQTLPRAHIQIGHHALQGRGGGVSQLSFDRQCERLIMYVYKWLSCSLKVDQHISLSQRKAKCDTSSCLPLCVPRLVGGPKLFCTPLLKISNRDQESN